MFRLPKKVVGMDLHDHSAQVVELKQGQTDISLEAYNRVILPAHVIHDGEVKPDREQEFKGMILDFLQGANPNAIESKNVAIILPAKKTFAHIFKMPGNFGEQEIKKAIPFEAETVIPFPIQDVYWDTTVLSSIPATKDDPVPNKYVLFAAIPKEIADTYARLFEGMWLTPYLFGVNVEALKYVLREQIEPDKASLIIDLGTLSTNYLILKILIHLFFFLHLIHQFLFVFRLLYFAKFVHLIHLVLEIPFLKATIPISFHLLICELYPMLLHILVYQE